MDSLQSRNETTVDAHKLPKKTTKDQTNVYNNKKIMVIILGPTCYVACGLYGTKDCNQSKCVLSDITSTMDSNKMSSIAVLMTHMTA